MENGLEESPNQYENISCSYSIILNEHWVYKVNVCVRDVNLHKFP